MWSASEPRLGPVRILYKLEGGLEPFGIVSKGSSVFVSDGASGIVLEITESGSRVVTDKLDTPSHIALDGDGNIIVADSGDHTVRRIYPDGKVDLVAGTPGLAGFRDGPAAQSAFAAPIGIAVDGGRIYVSDTYNDRIRIIEDGVVSTLAGSSRGYSDGAGQEAGFDTPCGIEILPDGSLLVADLGNRRLRMISKTGKTTTFAGDGRRISFDGTLLNGSFSAPVDVAYLPGGEIAVADGDRLRVLGARYVPFIETLPLVIEEPGRGPGRRGRLSGLAVTANGRILAADSANSTLLATGGDEQTQEVTGSEPPASAESPDRWPYDPPSAAREIAGTFGEIRGELETRESEAYFHNGLDITGSFGETARFVADEKVLDPEAVQNVGTLRELIRFPHIAYIHVNIGREADGTRFDDPRFRHGDEGVASVRVPRGARFLAGEPVGTLNRMNHVHLVVGASGEESNGLASLSLPGVSDSIPPVIEEIRLYDENWGRFETTDTNGRIRVDGRVRIVADGYDRMDGNAERRRLGIWGAGYSLLDAESTPVGSKGGDSLTIEFSRLPDPDLVSYIYSTGSRSGATGPTVFSYIVSNRLLNGRIAEGFIDFRELPKGSYTIEVTFHDYFGNVSRKAVDVISSP